MNIYIEICHEAKDGHGLVAVDAQAFIMFSPREGFDAEKIGELERDLGPFVTKRLNEAIKIKRGGAE